MQLKNILIKFVYEIKNEYFNTFIFSQNDENIILGNFIADYIRGINRIKEYPPQIQSGIKLHQWIDNYSDNNVIVKKSISIFSPSLKHYAPVAVDVIYDHFMANNWENFLKHH